jgi:hypothetical protein
MGVRTNLLAVTLTNTEVSTAQTNGQDAVGTLEMAAQGVADVIQKLNAILDFIPSGSNKTTIQTAITSLT